ncbi:MAG: TetR/AcrR family transcriptional regulator [Gracilibacteraceae bacterium]|nr:TetR/AcrR family transcriptional regulator [Gracilibacteraceae bacterium]
MQKSVKTSAKDRIIACARPLFRVREFESITVEQICAHAEISKKTFYYYFASKRDLLLACMGEQKQLNASELSAIFLSGASFAEQLWQVKSPLVNFIVDCGCEIMKELRAVLQDKTRVYADFKSDAHKLEAFLIEKAQQAGEIICPADAHTLVLVGWTQFLGLLDLWITLNGAFDFAATYRSWLENSIGVKPELRADQAPVLHG